MHKEVGVDDWYIGVSGMESDSGVSGMLVVMVLGVGWCRSVGADGVDLGVIDIGGD